MASFKNAIVHCVSFFLMALVFASCASENNLQCGDVTLTDQKLWEIAATELRQRGFTLALGPSKRKVIREDCDYVIRITYVPEFPGGHVFVVIDKYGTVKEIENGR